MPGGQREPENKLMGKNNLLPFLFGAILTACAVFIYPHRSFVLTALMLFLPLFDKQWQLASTNIIKYRLIILSLCCVAIWVLVGVNTDYAGVVLMTLFTAALPEEWFFRSYFMMRIERLGLRPYQANIFTSLFFTLLHLPTQGLFGLSVFIPSLIYGYIYQCSRDIVLLVLLHAISNIVFFVYIQDMLTG